MAIRPKLFNSPAACRQGRHFYSCRPRSGYDPLLGWGVLSPPRRGFLHVSDLVHVPVLVQAKSERPGWHRYITVRPVGELRYPAPQREGCFHQLHRPAKDPQHLLISQPVSSPNFVLGRDLCRVTPGTKRYAHFVQIALADFSWNHMVDWKVHAFGGPLLTNHTSIPVALPDPRCNARPTFSVALSPQDLLRE